MISGADFHREIIQLLPPGNDPATMFPPSKVRLLAHCLIAVLLAGCSESTPPPADRIQGETMGTTYSVLVHPLAESRLESLRSLVEVELERINASMSTYRDDSEISRFNKSTSTDWQPASPGLVEVVQQSLEVSRLSAGAFDVTVGPLVNLWGFGPDGQPATIPGQQQIDKLLEQVGYQHLHYRLDPPALRKDIPLLQIDLSAIAKGYGVDQVCQLLVDQGLRDFLVEIGGELRAMGKRPGGIRWKAGIESPVAGRRTVSQALELVDMALATSGDYRNFFVLNEKQYSHTIDPRTGWPVQHPVTSVSVLSASCMMADAWATALMASSPQVAYDKASELEIAAYWIIRGAGQLTKKKSPAFDSIFPAGN